ncbi:MAG: citrate synthase [Halioglobus sp.]|jgi:citrate synthase
MSKKQQTYSSDLAGIVVGETAISDVQGDIGLLSYRGIDIKVLANKPFEQLIWLVLFGEWPDERQAQQLNQFMSRHSQLSDSEIALLKQIPRELHPMLMLQGIVPLICPTSDDNVGFITEAAKHGLVLAAKIPALIAGHHRLASGQELIRSNSEMSFHENFLHLFHGAPASKDQVRMLDTAQILQMEHSFNAGTFAGRVCASTLAPIQSSISASIGTLFGKLHGGADQAALEMAMSIGGADKAEAFVKQSLANKVKIMGMGHREYRTVDPRALILKPMAVELCQDDESKALLATLIAVEKACQKEFADQGKEIWANVEFYKGAVFHSLGIPSHYFTAMFAMARVYGYIAHFMEFSKDSRLIRPRAIYKA